MIILTFNECNIFSKTATSLSDRICLYFKIHVYVSYYIMQHLSMIVKILSVDKPSDVVECFL